MDLDLDTEFLVGVGNIMPNSEDTKIVSSSSPRQFNAMSASKWSCVGRPKKSLGVDDKIISWNVGSIT